MPGEQASADFTSSLSADGRSMDHVTLVTVGEDGVDIANLLMSGILDKTGHVPLDGDFRTEPEFNQSPVFVDTGFGTTTGVLPADNLQTLNAELSWRRGPLWIASEYTSTAVDNPDLARPPAARIVEACRTAGPAGISRC